jgi:RES domain
MDGEGDEFVCRECVTDEYLWAAVRDQAERRTCKTCGNRRISAPLAVVADQVDSVFREHVQIGETYKAFGLDDDRGWWQQQGDEPSLLLQEIVGCDVDLADALVQALSESEWWVVRDGGDPFYDEGSSYVYAPDGLHEHHYVWQGFQEGVKYRSRFLDPEVQRELEELFTDFPAEWTAWEDGPVHGYAVGALSVYRARAASTEDEVREILRSAEAELGPPPRDRRRAGRLNAEGIGVFYGGFSDEVCIAEMRPSLASYVVVGRFELVRPIKVLDLTAFDRHRPMGSLFRPGFNEERLRWRFLQAFHWRITEPVQPDSEAMEYVPTQVIAEYLHRVLGFDGLVYRSAQVGVTGHEDSDEDPPPTPQELRNLALFNSEGLIEVENRGSEPGQESGESPHFGHFVFEPLDLSMTQSGRREPVLRYIGDSAEVYQIDEISYGWKKRFIFPDTESGGLSSDDYPDIDP